MASASTTHTERDDLSWSEDQHSVAATLTPDDAPLIAGKPHDQRQRLYSNLEHCPCALHTLWRKHTSPKTSETPDLEPPALSSSPPPPHCPDKKTPAPFFGAVRDCHCALHTLWRRVKGLPVPMSAGRLAGGRSLDRDWEAPPKRG